MVTVVYLEEAAEDLEETIAWYERRHRGLGARFHRCVEQLLARLAEAPLLGRPVHTARRVPVPGFPFVVVYRIVDGDLWIVAVAHTRRRPGYWRGR